MKILHIITGLNNGGAEAVLFRIATHKNQNVTHSVISLMDEGVYGEKLRDCGISVECLYLSKTNFFMKFFGLIRKIKTIQPDVVQTWMYHADLFGGIAAKIATNSPIVWGIHHSNLDAKESKFLTILIARISAFISRFIPDAIISCSHRGAAIHQELGYQKDKFTVIPNGYDLSAFYPDPSARQRLRDEWGVGDSEFLIGLVGRWNAQKDHHNLIQAISLLKKKNILIRCVLVGPNITKETDVLVQMLRSHDLESEVMLLGPRGDIPDVMNALDMHVLPSAFGEAFPNVVCEAMACGTSCVVTDVGDAAFIVGDTGWVVPPKNPERLASAIEDAMEQIRGEAGTSLKARCRERVQNNFEIEKIIGRYNDVWKSVMGHGK
jgi:glycosyltransferase involved in cell wall biosynthesis